MYPLNLTTQDIAALIPPKDTFIVVDQNGYRTQIAAGRHTIPFLERDGQY